MDSPTLHSLVAQLVERTAVNRQAEGSSPSWGAMKSKIDLEALLRECISLSYHIDGTGVLMATNQSEGLPPQIVARPHICAAINEIAVARSQNPLNVMVNKMPPGVVVQPHRDWLRPTSHQAKKPTLERWHLPVQTNPDALWWDEDSNVKKHYPLGIWFGPVPYWIFHSVENLGLTERVHLVVDLDTPHPIGSYRE